jgi:hypothetical protein
MIGHNESRLFTRSNISISERSPDSLLLSGSDNKVSGVEDRWFVHHLDSDSSSDNESNFDSIFHESDAHGDVGMLSNSKILDSQALNKECPCTRPECALCKAQFVHTAARDTRQFPSLPPSLQRVGVRTFAGGIYH